MLVNTFRYTSMLSARNSGADPAGSREAAWRHAAVLTQNRAAHNLRRGEDGPRLEGGLQKLPAVEVDFDGQSPTGATA